MLYEAGNLKWKSRLDRLVGQVRLAQPPYLVGNTIDEHIFRED
jgi:hypothetical protein